MANTKLASGFRIPAALQSSTNNSRQRSSRSSPVVLWGISVITAMGLFALLGYILWPFLGVSLGLFLLLMLVTGITLWKHPKAFFSNINLVLAAVTAMTGSTGFLHMSHPNLAGELGQNIFGDHYIYGILRSSSLFVLAASLISPRHSYLGLAWLYRKFKPVLRYMARKSATVAPKFAIMTFRFARFMCQNFYRFFKWVGTVIFAPVLFLLRKSRRALAFSQQPEKPLFALIEQPLHVAQTKSESTNQTLNQRHGGTGPESPYKETGIYNSSPPIRATQPEPIQTNVRWTSPSKSLLAPTTHKWNFDDINEKQSLLIRQTLADHGVDVSIGDIRPGPVVTQFGLVPGWIRRSRKADEWNSDGTRARGPDGKVLSTFIEEKTRVRVDNIVAREKDLALALAAPSIRFEAPVPGESFVGLEVPNPHPAIVTLRSIIEHKTFEHSQSKGVLPIALGEGSGGDPVVTDLADMPHLLIAGSTGSGKSVCMNIVICSLIMQFSPDELQMCLVDPKRVELTAYNDLPHLTGPVLVDADQVVPVLRRMVAEMHSRYKRFEELGVRNIQGYNNKISGKGDRIPYLVLVIDELADLMMTAPTDVEQTLCRLAQLGRATGIHLILATQRPSVDVLTGLIKANFPSRISFAVSSNVDSRTILDGSGAEKLLGRGDMLFLPVNAAKPKRLQGAFISDEEVNNLVKHWRSQGSNRPPPVVAEQTTMEAIEGADGFLSDAHNLAMRHGRISASLIQRKLGIGYAKATRILDQLEELGIVGAGDPGKSRVVIAPR